MQSSVLTGHHSPETAYVVDDYPYGFGLRCKIRYWTEYKRGRGVRMVSQTSNPKRGHAWNKPKASTFARFGLVMVLNQDGHVINGGHCSEYCSCQAAIDFQKNYAAALPCDEARAVLAGWVARKLKYEQAKAEGKVTMTVTTTTPDGTVSKRVEVLKPEGVTL